jgi:Tol biopolymer transport system component
LSSIINMCLDKDPARRYGSVAALADDIDRYLHGEPVAAQSRTLVYRIGKWLRKRRSAVAVIAVAAAAAVTGSWIASRPARSPLEPVPLTTYRGSESAPTFSPDARDVAFAWDGEHEDNWDIYRLHIGDNTPVRLTRGPAADYAPAWSPDGKSIAFLQAQSDDTANLMLMPAEGGPARQIAVAHMNINPRKRWITWSRDGQWLLLAHRGPGAPHQRVFAISVTNGEQRQLTHPNGPPSESDGQPALSLDGKIVLFARDSDTPGQLWMLPVTSDVRPAGVERRIKVPGFEGKECEVPLPISASELLFLAPLRSVRTFWRGKLSGGREPDALPELGQLPMAMDLSRDGRKLVFSKQNYDSNVWRIDLDAAGGKEIRRERILASTQWDENPALSPDGTTLAFESNRGGFPEIWLASVDGSDARPLTALGTLAASPLWSPDGSQIAFQGSRNGKSEVFVVPANGGAPREPAPDSAEAIQPVWSPDGKWLYFCSLRTGSREIWRVPAQGGQASQVTRHGGFDLAFSPDGSWIYYSRERASSTSIWRMPAEGGPESRLIESAIGGHVFATGRRLYFGQRSEKSGGCQIQALDLSTGEIRTLAITDRLLRSRLAVTHDERSIYFTQVDEDAMDLMLVSDFR